MLRRFGSHLRDQWMGAAALFLVLAGGTAYAVDGSLPGQNTVGSEDIINNDILSKDIADGRIFNVDLADNLITGQKMKDGTLTGADIEGDSITGADVSAIGGEDVTDGSLTGLDIEEETLGTVPLASDAQQVDGGSLCRTDGWLRMTEGAADETICQSGELSVITRCVDTADGGVRGDVRIRSAAGGWFGDAWSGRGTNNTEGGTGLSVSAALEPAFAEDNVEDLSFEAAPVGVFYAGSRQDSDSAISGTAGVQVRRLSVAPGGECYFVVAATT